MSVRPNGSPIINYSDGVASSYNTAPTAWVKPSDRRWADGPNVWQGRQRASNSQPTRGILSSVEGSLGGTPGAHAADKQRPKRWTTALTLGHLETKLNPTKLLDSLQEYKLALLLCARRIADGGLRARAEELVKGLFGFAF